MKESVTYQAIIQEGEAIGTVKGLRLALLAVGKKHFRVAPSARVKAALEAIENPERLLQLSVHVLEVKSWEELLPEAAASPPPRGRKRTS